MNATELKEKKNNPSSSHTDVTEKLNKIKKAQRELSQKLGRSVTTGEIAEELGMKTEEVTRISHKFRDRSR